MKKITFLNVILFTLISNVFAQDSMDFSASATYGFESEFVFRGFNISDDTFTPSAEARLLDENTTYYLGVRTALPTKKTDNKTKMHEYYFGGEFTVMDDFKVDLGLSYYDFLPYTDESPTEIQLGLTWDTLLSPAIYVYHDSDGELTTYEGSIGHAFHLDQKSAIQVTAYIGNSDFYVGSSYAGAMIDYSYSFTRYARFVVGARVSKLDPDEMLESETVSWWGVSFTSGF